MEPRRFVELDRAEALRRLGTVRIGRIVFTQNALPAVRPVSHVVDGGILLIREHAGVVPLGETGTVVAYEADELEPGGGVSWSVIVTGLARTVRDGTELARYARILTSWVAEQDGPLIRVDPELVTGFVLANGTLPPDR